MSTVLDILAQQCKQAAEEEQEKEVSKPRKVVGKTLGVALPLAGAGAGAVSLVNMLKKYTEEHNRGENPKMGAKMLLPFLYLALGNAGGALSNKYIAGE